jgi:hypothetical protein
MVEAEVERAALLALTYIQAFREQYMSREDGDYAEVRHIEGMSLLSMIGYSKFTPTDGTLLSLMRDPNPKHAVIIARVLIGLGDTWRAEAILHAWPNDPRNEMAMPAHGRLFEPYLAQWRAVEAVMELLSPMAWNAAQVEGIIKGLESECDANDASAAKKRDAPERKRAKKRD